MINTQLGSVKVPSNSRACSRLHGGLRCAAYRRPQHAGRAGPDPRALPMNGPSTWHLRSPAIVPPVYILDRQHAGAPDDPALARPSATGSPAGRSGEFASRGPLARRSRRIPRLACRCSSAERCALLSTAHSRSSTAGWMRGSARQGSPSVLALEPQPRRRRRLWFSEVRSVLGCRQCSPASGGAGGADRPTSLDESPSARARPALV